jgi:hypothetical protein
MDRAARGAKPRFGDMGLMRWAGNERTQKAGRIDPSTRLVLGVDIFPHWIKSCDRVVTLSIFNEKGAFPIKGNAPLTSCSHWCLGRESNSYRDKPRGILSLFMARIMPNHTPSQIISNLLTLLNKSANFLSQ